jgi:hypothetical protein
VISACEGEMWDAKDEYKKRNKKLSRDDNSLLNLNYLNN